MALRVQCSAAMDSPEYLAEQLVLAERRLREARAPDDVAFWRARLEELHRRAAALTASAGR